VAEPSEAQSIEVPAEAAWRRGDFVEVANTVFAGYGGEIYSFLLAQFRGELGAADEVFSDFSEDFWRGLPSFQWRCSIRGWCYKLARSASSRHRRAPPNQRNKRVALNEAFSIDELAQVARTTTLAHLRTEVKDKIRELRDQLSRSDQDLLILRIDRDLSWRDIAHAMSTASQMPDDEELRRAEAALRQRFADIKKRLKRMAEQAGLL
jgi:RNA polymerase sigma-70 factor (ECF subfamily)